MISYNRKSEMRKSRNGIDCYVFNSPVPLFMKISGGQRLRFRGIYFQESFFRENNVALYDSFWEDAKRSLAFNELHSPELLSIYQRIEKCPLTGEAFRLWMRGQGLAAAGYLLDLVQKYTSAPPVYLSEDEIVAVLQAKRLIKENIDSVPTILELSKRVALNKNKLQKAFQLTEGKSVGEYIRTLRMERALELLEKSDLNTSEIAKAVGYHGVSNFYHAFPDVDGRRHHLAGNGVCHAVAVTIAKKYLGLNRRQAMQTCTCLRFWRVFYPPKRLLRDSPQASKIVPFGDGCTSCGR